MGFLLEADEQIQKDVYYSVAHIFNLEVDLIYFDTISTYFEIEEEGEFRKKAFVKTTAPICPKRSSAWL
jgi:hypothetical protein